MGNRLISHNPMTFAFRAIGGNYQNKLFHITFLPFPVSVYLIFPYSPTPRGGKPAYSSIPPMPRSGKPVFIHPLVLYRYKRTIPGTEGQFSIHDVGVKSL